MTELASKEGDCALAILATASGLGCEPSGHLGVEADFTCKSEGALAKLLDKPTFDTIMIEVSRREKEGTLKPCESSSETRVLTCFQKCPLLMDLVLQADKLKDRPEL